MLVLNAGDTRYQGYLVKFSGIHFMEVISRMITFSLKAPGVIRIIVRCVHRDCEANIMAIPQGHVRLYTPLNITLASILEAQRHCAARIATYYKRLCILRHQMFAYDFDHHRYCKGGECNVIARQEQAQRKYYAALDEVWGPYF